jgi:hypothetical protein
LAEGEDFVSTDIFERTRADANKRMAEGVSLVRIPQYQLVIVASWQTLVRIDPQECLAF